MTVLYIAICSGIAERKCQLVLDHEYQSESAMLIGFEHANSVNLTSIQPSFVHNDVKGKVWA